MKRLLIIFMINRALLILRTSNIDYNILVLWIILNLRWPENWDHTWKNILRKFLKWVSRLPLLYRETYRSFSNQDVIDVINGKDIGVSLNEQNIKAIIEG